MDINVVDEGLLARELFAANATRVGAISTVNSAKQRDTYTHKLERMEDGQYARSMNKHNIKMRQPKI